MTWLIPRAIIPAQTDIENVVGTNSYDRFAEVAHFEKVVKKENGFQKNEKHFFEISNRICSVTTTSRNKSKGSFE